MIGARGGILFFLLLLGQVARAQPLGGFEPGSEEDPRAAALLKRTAAILAEGGGQGAALAVVSREGIVLTAGVGLADVAARRPVRPDTVFQVASVSKLFVALALQNLVSEGRVDLDAPLASLLPELTPDNPWHATAPITVRHLLEHTSGIQEVIAPWPSSPERALAPVSDILQHEVRAGPVLWPPGTTATYSNYNYLVIAALIERLTGEPFDAYIQRTIFVPLGMFRSTFRLADVDRGSLARGYKGGPEESIEPGESFYRPAAGLYTTAGDLALFLRAMLQGGGGVTTPETLERLERPTASLAARHGLRIGHGGGAVARQMNGRVFAGHSGIIDGFMASLYYSRSLGLGYAVLLNAHALPQAPSVDRIRDAVLGLFFNDRVDEPEPAVAVPAAELQQYAGFYQRVNARFAAMAPFAAMLDSQIVAVDEEGRLTRRGLFEAPRPLVPVGGERFRFDGEVAAHAVFGRTPDGKEFLHVSPNGYHVRTAAGPLVAQAVATAASIGVVMLLVVYLLVQAAAAGRRLVARVRRSGSVRAAWAPRCRRAWCVPAGVVAAVAALAGMLGVATTLDTSPAATTFNAATATFWALSWAFAGATIVGVSQVVWRLARGTRGRAAWTGVVAAAACAWLAVLLARGGWIGMHWWGA